MPNERARKFLEFVAANDTRLRHNLRKNITYDEELFDDVYQETVVRTYDSLCRNDTEIDDYEQYFFIASKFNYINAQNKKRKEQKLSVDIDYSRHDVGDEPYDYDADFATEKKLQELTADVYDRFGVSDSNLYFSYILNKVSGITSYSKMAAIHNIDVKLAKKIIQEIKTYIDSKYADDKQKLQNELF